MDTVSNYQLNLEKSQLICFKRSGIIVLGQWVSLLQQPNLIPARCVGFVQLFHFNGYEMKACSFVCNQRYVGMCLCSPSQVSASVKA